MVSLCDHDAGQCHSHRSSLVSTRESTGYGYLEAGRNVITLFQNKGWSSIIADDLADNVLFMVSAAIGLLTGLVGLVLGKIDQDLFAGIGVDDSGMVGFV